jgi:hypothetical protein
LVSTHAASFTDVFVWPQHSAYFGLFRPNSDRWSNGIFLRGHLADLDVDRRRNLVEQTNMHKSRLDYVHRGSTLVPITLVFFIATKLASSLGLSGRI